MEESTTTTPVSEVKTNKDSIQIPSVKELLKAGVQFGHEAKRWNPKMKKYIFGEKNHIHVIDINQTEKKLEEAAKFLQDAASRGKILFIGTKRQASNIVKDEAIRAGAYFINVRWAGGLLTNFPVVKKSLTKLNNLEKSFEEGIEGRTKYEVSRMKKEWQRLARLYSGIKTLNERPTAAVIVDSNFEKSAVKECRKLKLPIVGIVDTNSDPDVVDYIIPANDDAIGSLKLLMKTLSDAVLSGNKGSGVKHMLKNYDEVEIKITIPVKEQPEEEKVSVAEIETEVAQESKESAKKEEAPAARSRTKVKGILERVKEDAAKKTEKTETQEKKIKAPTKIIKKEEVKREPLKESKKPVKKEAKKAATKTTTKKATTKKSK